MERLSETTFMVFTVKDILVHKRTPFQEVLICKVEEFGKTLFIDRQLQSTEIDQEIYHSALVYPAMQLAKKEAEVLVIGGGEGATIERALSLGAKKVTMVDIDQELVELCKKNLPEFHRGSFDDLRVTLYFKDGFDFIKTTGHKYDVIICDLPDPYRQSLSEGLYSTEFYQSAFNVLQDNGVLVTQAGSPWFRRENFERVGENLRVVFKQVVSYQKWVPSYGSTWGFYLALKKPLEESVINNALKSTIESKSVFL